MIQKHDPYSNGILKAVMHYHRSYRKIPTPPKGHLIPFFFLIVSLEVLLYIFFPTLNDWVSRCAREILAYSLPFEKIEMTGITFLWQPVTLLNIAGSYPSARMAAIHFIITLLIIFIIPQTKTPKPIAVSLTLMSLIHLVSAVYFLFIPQQFPYRVIDFSTTYMVMVIVTWFLIPVVYGFILYPLPSSLFSKIFIVLFTITFSLAFNVCRYSIFLYMMHVHSLIFMAVLFFCFGILLDTIFIVGFYAFYLSLLSTKLRNDVRVWQWLY